MRYFIILFWMTVPGFALAVSETQTEARADLIRSVASQHILPGVEHLVQTSADLATAAQNTCDANDPELRRTYGVAFDAWIAVSHLRFGPFETDNRGFALAFWPDTRSKTPKALNAMIRNADPVALDVAAFGNVSVAARGFYALEFLLYDPALSRTDPVAYRCQLLRMITADISATSEAILTDWQRRYAPLILTAGVAGNTTYQTADEAVQELFKAVLTGLQFTADTRLGRPLGTFDRPRPKRAEAWRSSRSSRHVKVSLSALRDIAIRLAPAGSRLKNKLGAPFDRALSLLAELNDPVFAGVAAPHTRIKIEIVQQSVDEIRRIIRHELGPKLGVRAGFNAMDGD